MLTSSPRCRAIRRLAASRRDTWCAKWMRLAASWAGSPMPWESNSGCSIPREVPLSGRREPNVKIKQAEVADLIVEESSVVGPRSSTTPGNQHSGFSIQPITGTDHAGAGALTRPAERSSENPHEPPANNEANEGRPTTDEPPKRVLGIRLRDGRTVGAKAVVITTGTFLNGLIHCGEQQYPAGRSGEPPAVLLGEALKNLGLRGCRLKTGTPPRLDGRSIDWSKFQEQPGDSDPTPFSFRTSRVAHHESQVPCYIAWTTPETHELIRRNVHRSPMYSGQIQSIG